MTDPYHNEFKSWADVAKDFSGCRWDKDSVKKALAIIPEPTEVLYAAYTQEGYEGSAYVLYRQGRKYYEVSGSHCSCYGLEDQWEPTEHTKGELKKLLKRRITDGYFYGPFTRDNAEGILEKLNG